MLRFCSTSIMKFFPRPDASKDAVRNGNGSLLFRCLLYHKAMGYSGMVDKSMR
jgi:hypothetical protein